VQVTTTYPGASAETVVMRRSTNAVVPKRDVLNKYTCKVFVYFFYKFSNILTKAESNDNEQVMGSFSTANATATGWAMLPPSATPPPLTEGRTPLDRE
jgi:hypothetical protein